MTKSIRLISLITVLLGSLLFAYSSNSNTPSIAGQKEQQQPKRKNQIKDGDIIFQSSVSAQCKAVQLATKSIYSHCGIIFEENGKYFVYEAVQPVMITPLDEWIARGQSKHYVIKRLKNANQVLSPEALQKIKQECKIQLGKNYDMTFEWSDDNIYCSELIWKAYKRATGIEVGKLEKLKDFDLSSPIVKQKLVERYGNNIPLDEVVISPAAIYNSERLETVLSEN